jgi:Fe-S-cluster-containing dehydrogenase component
MDKEQNQKPSSGRRSFLKMGLVSGISAAAGIGIISKLNPVQASDIHEKIKVLTTDGKLIEIDKSSINDYPEAHITPEQARDGIPHRKFVMVIDLAKCKNARKCITECQKGHHLPASQEFMKVYLMQETEESAPYWMPKSCFHCDKPLCVSVCPVGATYKRSDGIVLIDNERCIGCKFCMTGCPYSARIFNWGHSQAMDVDQPYSPETSVPAVEGTVSKCDFCPDLIRVGKLPHCVSGCPMGVIYFGDINEDIVTNGDETIRFSQLISDRSGFRHLEDLGTKPSVYYLPPVNRQFPVERGFPENDPELMERYKNVPFVKKMNEENN